MENNVLTWKLSTEKEGRLGRKLRTVQVSLRPVESMTELEKFRGMSLRLPPVRSHWQHVVGWSPRGGGMTRWKGRRKSGANVPKIQSKSWVQARLQAAAPSKEPV